MKIIWHFKTQYLTQEEQKDIEILIKQFNDNSLVIFAEDLEIHIINENEKQKTKNEKVFVALGIGGTST